MSNYFLIITRNCFSLN